MGQGMGRDHGPSHGSTPLRQIIDDDVVRCFCIRVVAGVETPVSLTRAYTYGGYECARRGSDCPVESAQAGLQGLGVADSGPKFGRNREYLLRAWQRTTDGDPAWISGFVRPRRETTRYRRAGWFAIHQNHVRRRGLFEPATLRIVSTTSSLFATSRDYRSIRTVAFSPARSRAPRTSICLAATRPSVVARRSISSRSPVNTQHRSRLRAPPTNQTKGDDNGS